jgi:hypothetical protein
MDNFVELLELAQGRKTKVGRCALTHWKVSRFSLAQVGAGA